MAEIRIQSDECSSETQPPVSFCKNTFNWKIDNFLFQFQNYKDPILSPKFTLLGTDFQFRLKRLVQGCNVYQDWIVIHLDRCSLTGLNIFTKFTLGIRNKNNEVYKSLRVAYMFKENENPPAFVEKAMFLENKRLFKSGDTLIIFCKVEVDSSPAEVTDSSHWYYSSASNKNSLTENLKNLYLNKIFCDVKLSVKGQIFEAHRAILAGRSSVFASVLHCAMDNETVEIADCDIELFENFLFYLYTGRLQNTSVGNLMELYHMANKYNVKPLKAHCFHQLKSHISTTNFPEIIHFAMTIEESNMKYFVREFVLEKFSEITASEAWEPFIKEHKKCCDLNLELPFHTNSIFDSSEILSTLDFLGHHELAKMFGVPL